MTPERKAELRALADAATPGPWLVGHTRNVQHPNAKHPYVETTQMGGDGIIYGGECWKLDLDEDELSESSFIAAARTTIPELLDALEEAERGNDVLRSLNDHARDEMTLLRARVAKLESDRPTAEEIEALESCVYAADDHWEERRSYGSVGDFSEVTLATAALGRLRAEEP